MSHAVETIQSMGQPDEYQARCKPCQWGGDVHASRAAAMKEGLAHDAEAHAPDGPTDQQGMPVVRVEEILQQLTENAPKLAPVYHAHYQACVDAGFDHESALVLTSDWARVTLWGAQL